MRIGGARYVALAAKNISQTKQREFVFRKMLQYFPAEKLSAMQLSIALRNVLEIAFATSLANRPVQESESLRYSLSSNELDAFRDDRGSALHQTADDEVRACPASTISCKLKFSALPMLSSVMSAGGYPAIALGSCA